MLTYTSALKMYQNGDNMDAIATLLGYLLLLTGTIWVVMNYPWLIFALGATIIAAKWLDNEPIGEPIIKRIKGIWKTKT